MDFPWFGMTQIDISAVCLDGWQALRKDKDCSGGRSDFEQPSKHYNSLLRGEGRQGKTYAKTHSPPVVDKNRLRDGK